MKRQKLHTICLILFVLYGSAVLGKTNSRPDNNVNMYGSLFLQPRGLEGSPYVFKDWSIGTVNLYNGQTASDLLVKFNILSNDLIFYNEKFKNLFTADRETVSSFTMETQDGQKLLFIKYNDESLGYKLNKGDFVHQIYDGKLQLLIKYSASISDANELNSRDKINPLTYYFVIDSHEATEIRLKLKSIIKLYPDRKQEIKKLASQLHFRKNSVGHMVQLIKAIE